MAELLLHNRTVHSVFELLGTKENHVTYSLGWALAQCPCFRSELLERVFPKAKSLEAAHVKLQQRHHDDGGITDIEIFGDDIRLIVEAKRGWTLPTAKQLALYAPRLRKESERNTALLTMSECSREYAALNQPAHVQGIPLHHMSWRDVQNLCVKRGNHREKRLIGEFRTYLERIVKMQPQESNLVYVVSLGSGYADDSRLTWVQIVRERYLYYHTMGKSGWPKEPPNYIGVRYKGQLQSIHHVESWVITKDAHAVIPEFKSNRWKEDHFVYKLGPAIIPPKIVKTGSIYPNGRVWAMLDLLLTCESVSEARDITKKRLKLQS